MGRKTFKMSQKRSLTTRKVNDVYVWYMNNDLLSEIEKGVFCLVMCVGQRKNSEFP